MTDNNNNKYPKKFVGLHSHGTFSVGDGIGYPQDHIDYARSNGMDAIALTDHGNLNGFSHQYFYSQKLQKQGVNFKALPGIEAYFVDSLSKWKELYDLTQEKKQLRKAAKKGDFEARKKLEQLGDPFAETKQEMDQSYGADDGGAVVENEEESKTNKFKDPIKQRNHLVLLPKNSEGLQALFQMVTDSYREGFYFYPRVDLDMLKKYSKGNIIALSACIGGNAARKVFDYQTEPDWEKWAPNMEHFEKIQSDLKEVAEKFKWALGDENYYFELQFNKLGAQHLVNQHLIEASARTNTQLVATVDAHYSHPEHWRQREIYKMMAWASRGMGMDKDKLPEKIDELKCELYPKNADQVWQSYKDYTAGKNWDFYNDDLVCEAIERTYTIAHEQIDNPMPDTSVKLPAIKRMVKENNLDKFNEELQKGLGEDSLAFKELKRQAIEGIKKRGFAQEQEYIERLKEELLVVKYLKFSKYFLTYSKIMDIVTKHMLSGVARGSAGGSLLAYVLNITQVDPIKYGLLFERFLSIHKKGMPDIDCLHENMLVKLDTGKFIEIKNLNIGDRVMDHCNQLQKVLMIKNRISDESDVLYNIIVKCENLYGSILTTSKHRLIDKNGNNIFVEDLQINQELHSPTKKKIFVLDKIKYSKQIKLVDITVENSATFQFIPYNCYTFTRKKQNYLFCKNDYSLKKSEYEQKIEFYEENNRNSQIIKL